MTTILTACLLLAAVGAVLRIVCGTDLLVERSHALRDAAYETGQAFLLLGLCVVPGVAVVVVAGWLGVL